MRGPNYQEMTEKFTNVLVTLQSSIRNMEKLKVNPAFLSQISQQYTELVKITDQINRLIKENPEIANNENSLTRPKQF